MKVAPLAMNRMLQDDKSIDQNLKETPLKKMNDAGLSMQVTYDSKRVISG